MGQNLSSTAAKIACLQMQDRGTDIRLFRRQRKTRKTALIGTDRERIFSVFSSMRLYACSPTELISLLLWGKIQGGRNPILD